MSLLPSLAGLPLAPPEVVDTEVKRFRSGNDSDDEHDYLPYGPFGPFPLDPPPSVQARAVAPPWLRPLWVAVGTGGIFFAGPSPNPNPYADAD